MRGKLTRSGDRRSSPNGTDLPILPCTRMGRERYISLYRPGGVDEAERVAPAEAVACHGDPADVEGVAQVVDWPGCQWFTGFQDRVIHDSDRTEISHSREEPIWGTPCDWGT